MACDSIHYFGPKVKSLTGAAPPGGLERAESLLRQAGASRGAAAGHGGLRATGAAGRESGRGPLPGEGLADPAAPLSGGHVRGGVMQPYPSLPGC